MTYERVVFKGAGFWRLLIQVICAFFLVSTAFSKEGYFFSWGKMPGQFGLFASSEKIPQKGPFRVPQSFIISPSGEFFVLDNLNARVQKFRGGRFIDCFRLPEAGEDGVPFLWPDIAISDSGEIFISNPLEGWIEHFDAGGRLLESVGLKGTSPGQFLYPFRLRYMFGKLLVEDQGRKKIIEMGKDLRVEREFPFPALPVCDKEHRVYGLLWNGRKARVLRFVEEGTEEVFSFDIPSKTEFLDIIEIDSSGNIIVNAHLKSFSNKGASGLMLVFSKHGKLEAMASYEMPPDTGQVENVRLDARRTIWTMSAEKDGLIFRNYEFHR